MARRSLARHKADWMLALLIRNLFTLALVLVTAPVRLLRSRARPEWVRFRIKGDPPYRAVPRRRWPFGRKLAPDTIASLYAFGKQLDTVCAEPKVKGIVVELEGAQISPAKRE